MELDIYSNFICTILCYEPFKISYYKYCKCPDSICNKIWGRYFQSALAMKNIIQSQSDNHVNIAHIHDYNDNTNDTTITGKTTDIIYGESTKDLPVFSNAKSAPFSLGNNNEMNKVKLINGNSV